MFHRVLSWSSDPNIICLPKNMSTGLFRLKNARNDYIRWLRFPLSHRKISRVIAFQTSHYFGHGGVESFYLSIHFAFVGWSCKYMYVQFILKHESYSLWVKIFFVTKYYWSISLNGLLILSILLPSNILVTTTFVNLSITVRTLCLSVENMSMWIVCEG